MTTTVWMPLYWGDYLRDTGHLSAAEHGAYLLLLGHYWVTRRPLPDDDRQLARIARMTPDEWADARSIIQAFFEVRDGHWYQRRLEAELVTAAARKNANVRRAKTAANARWGKGKRERAQPTDREDAVHDECSEHASSNASPVLERCQSQSQIYSDADASGATAPPDDPAKLIFGHGVTLLVMGGRPKHQARSILGKWRRDHGDAAVIDAISRAGREAASDPVAFIEGYFRSRASPRSPQRSAVMQELASLREVERDEYRSAVNP